MRSGPPQAQYWDREGLFSNVIWKVVIYLESEETPPAQCRKRHAIFTRKPEQPEKIGVIRQKTAESSGKLAEISAFQNGDFGFFLVQPNATKKCCFGGHLGVFNCCSCSCCSRRTPRVRCVFANATFTGGRATARSHENRSRGVVLSCRVRWHMRGGTRVPCYARAPQQREQRSRFLHCAYSNSSSSGNRNGCLRLAG